MRITKRAVLYVGHLCNLQCKFCYYLYIPDKIWYPLEKCKSYAKSFREDFNDNAVDITGGEPTIYPDILELVKYCRDIGLKPTIITNCQTLADIDKVKQFKDAGIEDFLCSIHAWEQKYDKLVNKPGGFKAIQKTINNLNKLNIPFRVNCVLTTESKDNLIQIASYAYNNNAKVINFISYNPFYEWAHFNVPDFQERHNVIASYLKLALDYCDSVGLEANVRYFPFCQMKPHLDKCYNFPQLSYDPGEWDLLSWFSDKYDAPSHKYTNKYYNSFQNIESCLYAIAKDRKRSMYSDNEKCKSCMLHNICDGLTNQYFLRFGPMELAPFSLLPGQREPKSFRNIQPNLFIQYRPKYLWQKEEQCSST